MSDYDFDGYALTISDGNQSLTLFGEEAADLFDQLESAETDEVVENLIDPYFPLEED